MKVIVRDYGVKLAATLGGLLKHASEHPFFKHEDTSEVDSMLISISDDIIRRNGLGTFLLGS